jgi:uncharacterized membrane protein
LAAGRPVDEARRVELDAETYTRVGYTLLGGLLVSIAVMVLGLVLAVAHGGNETKHVLRIEQVLPHLTNTGGSAVLDLGILLLFATPLLAVIVALVEFIRQRDTAFAGITALLLVVLAIGFGIALR